MKIKIRFLALIFMAANFALTAPVTAAESLGIGLTVIPLNDGSEAKLSFNNQLWFGIESGKSLTREFNVSSASKIKQRINLSLYDVFYDNGTRQIRTDRPSVTSDWVTFSPNNVVVAPGGVARIKMTYTIPKEIEDGSFEAFLRVSASAANLPSPTSDEDGGVKVILPGAAAIDTPVWLGIGDATSLVSDFEFKRVFGYSEEKEKRLRLIVENTGKTPLGIGGTVQLADPTFTDRSFGPFGFRSTEIQPGKEVAIDVALPAEISEGRWRIYVVAEQGNIRKSKIFEEDLTFQPLTTPFPIHYLFILLGLVGLFMGWRLFRPTNATTQKPEAPSIQDRAADVKSDDFITKLLADLEIEEFVLNRDKNSKKPARKKPAKRAVKKKSASKKAPAKKKIPSKPSARKKPVKKSAKKLQKTR